MVLDACNIKKVKKCAPSSLFLSPSILSQSPL
jgi:hypothetical protein